MTNFKKGKSFAERLDLEDPLAQYRENFHIPKSQNGNDVIYFLGNSLGLQPKGAIDAVMEEMGYETNNIILNLGSVFIYLAWYVVLFFIVLI